MSAIPNAAPAHAPHVVARLERLPMRSYQRWVFDTIATARVVALLGVETKGRSLEEVSQ